MHRRRTWWRRRLGWLAAAGVVVVATTGVAAAAAGAFDPDTVPPPWSKRCAVEIKAYEDASASLYCEGKRKPFGAVDAESGRIRFFSAR